MQVSYMVNLPISKTALKYYEDIGYKFSFKEQAHLCYHYAPGLLERIDLLKKILVESDDEELNKNIQEIINYEFGCYSKFMDNEDNLHIYVLESDSYDGRKRRCYFRSIGQALSYAERNIDWESQINAIHKVLLLDGNDDLDKIGRAHV